jgi:hypothetical protein
LTAQAFPVPLSSHLCTTDVAPLKKQNYSDSDM